MAGSKQGAEQTTHRAVYRGDTGGGRVVGKDEDSSELQRVQQLHATCRGVRAEPLRGDAHAQLSVCGSRHGQHDMGVTDKQDGESASDRPQIKHNAL